MKSTLRGRGLEDVTRGITESGVIKSRLAAYMPRLGRLGDYRRILASTGTSQVASSCVWVIILGDPSGDLQLSTLLKVETLVALNALARTYALHNSVRVFRGKARHIFFANTVLILEVPARTL